jgi:SAM-dependent methyltransferase
MGGYIDLLQSLPKSKRDIHARYEAKDKSVIDIAKRYGKEYFDGDRKYGYGGYRYDGRWMPVARDIIGFFNLNAMSKILDVGCAKGFLLYDLMNEGMDVRGVDISRYAIDCSHSQVRRKLQQGSADSLPFMDKSFDLVISINTLHNLPREGVIKALREIERVSRGDSYVVVDSYYSVEQKKLFEDWVLTAETHYYPEGWLQLFKDAGYTGHYSWNVL